MQQYMKVVVTLEFKIPQNGEDPEKWLMPIIYDNLEKDEEVTGVSTQYTLWKDE